MESESQGDGGGPTDHNEEESLDEMLEALLVEDADVVWDPVTGRPRVTRRQKGELDRPPGSA